MNIIQYENYQEKRKEMTSGLPYITYLCSIPLDFTKVPLHWHDEMELIYIKKGRGRVSVGLVSLDLVSYEVREGDIVIVCPGQLHTIEQQGRESMEYENIIFQMELLNSRHPDSCWEKYLSPILHGQKSLPGLLNSELPYYSKAASCLDQIDEIRRTFPDGYELLIKGKLFELFFLLCSNEASPLSRSESGLSIRQEKSLEKTRQILKYMEQHYSEHLTIKEMAEACGFSQSHFMKFFKAALGEPFISYLNDYRLTMASRLLLSSEASVLTVAADTGFDNLSYFNRVFKKKFGMTPSSFRKLAAEAAAKPVS